MPFPQRSGQPTNTGAGGKRKAGPRWFYWIWPAMLGVRSILLVVEQSGGPAVPNGVIIVGALLVGGVGLWRWRAGGGSRPGADQVEAGRGVRDQSGYPAPGRVAIIAADSQERVLLPVWLLEALPEHERTVLRTSGEVVEWHAPQTVRDDGIWVVWRKLESRRRGKPY